MFFSVQIECDTLWFPQGLRAWAMIDGILRPGGAGLI